MVDSPGAEIPSDENYSNFFLGAQLPFKKLLCVGCSNVATNTIVPQYTILSLSVSIKNALYKMLATNNH